MTTHLRTLQTLIKTNPALSATAAALLSLCIIAYRDYRAYTSLGPHGLPPTLWGWYKQLLLTLKARKDITIPAPYDLSTVAGPHDRTSYLPTTGAQGLSWRPGNKAPLVPGVVAPQRQTTDIATSTMKKKMYTYLDWLVSQNPSILQTQPSILEGPVPALSLKNFQSLPHKLSIYNFTKGEMCHIHPPDGSTHLMISLVDQKRVIELGWGIRHRLSGGGMLPWNYTFLYAPRDEAELETWKSVVAAGVRFCCADVGEVTI